MGDSLTILGHNYTNVKGFKATETGDGTLTYIRPDGTKSITSNGSNIDVAAYAKANVNVQPSLEHPALQTYTPTENEQTDSITPSDPQYYGLSQVDIKVNAIDSNYVGSSIDRNDSTDLVVTDDTVDVPAGYYENAASASVQGGSVTIPALTITANPMISINTTTGVVTSSVTASQSITPTVSAGYVSSVSPGSLSISGSATDSILLGTEGTPVATKGTADLVNHTIDITPSVTNSEGYIAGSTINGTPVSVAASELVDGTLAITSSGTHDVTNYKNASIGAGSTTPGATIVKDAAQHKATITPKVTRSAGYITQGVVNGGNQSVYASELVSGTKSITANGTSIDVTNYAEVDVAVPPDLYDEYLAYTPSETAISDTVYPESGDGFSSVTVNVGAISSSYVGSSIVGRDSTDLTASGATVTVPAGYYDEAATKTIGSGSATASASKSVSGHMATITPRETRTAGYVSAGYSDGTAVTVAASELVSGTKSITANGTDIDVTNYKYADVAVPAPVLQSKTKSYTPTETAQSETVSADNGYDALSSVAVSVGAISSSYVGSAIDCRDSTNLSASGATVTAPAGYYENAATKTIGSGSARPVASISSSGATLSTGTGTIILTKDVTNVPDVTAGYVASGTSGTTSITLQAAATLNGATTYHPSTSDQTIASGTYLTGAQTIKAVTLANLIAGNIKKDVVVKIGDSTDDDCVASVTGTYEASGGTDHLTKLATKSLGTISTSSTSAADTGQTLNVEGFDAYDMLIAICHTSPHTNGRHVATVRLINFSGTSNVNTKTSTSIATSTQHYKLSSSGTLAQRSGTTPYGVYVNAATIQTTTPRKCTLTIYQRYNSTSSGTINGNYVLDVYGVKLQDLF